VFGDKLVTYGELNARANQLAHRLRGPAVGPDMLVGIFVERSIAMPVSLMGILAAGAYVSLNPYYLANRLAFLLANTAVSALLTQRRLLKRLPEMGVALVCPREVAGDRPGDVLSRLRLALRRDQPLQVDVDCDSIRGGRDRFAQNVAKRRALCLGNLRTASSEYPAAAVLDDVMKYPRHRVQTLAENRVSQLTLVRSLRLTILTEIPHAHISLPELRIWIASGELRTTKVAEHNAGLLPHATLLNLYGLSAVAADVM
jgi:hypothetical protein